MFVGLKCVKETPLTCQIVLQLQCSIIYIYIIKIINPTAIEPGVMFTNLNSELGHHLHKQLWDISWGYVEILHVI